MHSWQLRNIINYSLRRLDCCNALLVARLVSVAGLKNDRLRQ